jgi:hypothetical protein
MATLELTWTQVAQTALTSSVDQEAQYKQLGLAFVNTMIAAGHPVSNSSTSLAFGASNLIVSTASIVHANAGSAHSWAQHAVPSGKGTPSGSAHGTTIDFTEAVADTTPQAAGLYIGRGTYTSGSLTAKPTTTAESAVITFNLVPWTAPVAGSYVAWYNSAGDVYFGVKANGESFFRTFIIIAADDLRGKGSYRLVAWAQSGTTNALTMANLLASTNWRYFLGDGTVTGSPALAPQCVLWQLGNWVNSGREATGIGLHRDVELFGNAGGGLAAQQRALGFLRDIRGVPQTTAFNDADTSDVDAYVHRCIGAIAIPSNATIT